MLAHTDAATGKPFVDVVLDQAEQKGTGRWTVQTALDLGRAGHRHRRGGVRPLAVRARRAAGRRGAGLRRRPADEGSPSTAKASSTTSARRCTPPKVVAYAQGFDQIAAGSDEYGWDIDLGAMATIWRGGCIIRARSSTGSARRTTTSRTCRRCWSRPTSPPPCQDGEDSWRRVVAAAARAGIPTPGFSSSLAYYDGLRRPRLPAALIQGLRDFFGAHTYRRVDRDGAFHTLVGAGPQRARGLTPGRVLTQQPSAFSTFVAFAVLAVPSVAAYVTVTQSPAARSFSDVPLASVVTKHMPLASAPPTQNAGMVLAPGREDLVVRAVA